MSGPSLPNGCVSSYREVLVSRMLVGVAQPWEGAPFGWQSQRRNQKPPHREVLYQRRVLRSVGQIGQVLLYPMVLRRAHRWLTQDAATQYVQVGTAVHLALEEFEPVHLSFDLPWSQGRSNAARIAL
jgi:hypothetical protein